MIDKYKLLTEWGWPEAELFDPWRDGVSDVAAIHTLQLRCELVKDQFTRVLSHTLSSILHGRI